MKKLSISFVVLATSFNIMAREVVVSPNNYQWMSEKDYTFQKSTAKERSSRKVASQNEITDDLMSKEYKAFRTKFLTLKTPEELDAYLTELDSKYDTYPDDLKLTVALITPWKVMKSFVYKTYPLATKEKITHSAIVTQILNTASFIKINLPTDQWMAGFKYVTEPMSLDVDQERISTVEELQSFVGEKVYPELLKSANRISKIKISEKMIWDNKLLYGVGSFSDNFKRFKTFGEAERFAVLSSLHANMAAAARFQAYNVTDLVPFMKEIASLYGYDSALFSEVDGVTAKKIQNVLMKPKYKNLFVLRPNGAQNMASAYKHMKESTRLGLISWTETRDRGADENDLFNSEFVTAMTTRVDRNAEIIERVMMGPTTLRSDLTGEVIDVNFPNLYLNPIKDLKSLAPIAFEEGPKHINKLISNKKFQFRNYFYGRAIKWNESAYRNIFPELKSGENVSNYVRILNQSSGSELITSVVNASIIY